jgi:hypothetical protein
MRHPNIWTERKVHIAKSGLGSRPLCGASALAECETRVWHGFSFEVPQGVTCQRCIKLHDVILKGR